jgi:dihydropteroate synthase
MTPVTNISPWVSCRNGRLDLSSPVIMGVLNVTPDSFSDGGRFLRPRQAIDHALRMVEDGATIIDVGGESTRPGAGDVPAEQELDRVIPIIESVRSRVDALISIDTSKPLVMREAAAAGADLINDVYALRAEGALDAVRELGTAVCLMHMQGTPRTMQANPVYEDVVSEVRGFLDRRRQACVEAGIPRDKVIVDPGFGFGKTLEHNLELLRGWAACVISAVRCWRGCRASPSSEGSRTAHPRISACPGASRSRSPPCARVRPLSGCTT